MGVNVVPSELTGPVGHAVRVDEDRLRASLTGDTVATLDCWWMHVPNQPVMVVHASGEPRSIESTSSLQIAPAENGRGLDWFAVGVITLADLPGVPRARKQYPWVTHEVTVVSIDPASNPRPDAPLPWKLMQPHNLSVQFECRTDHEARLVCADLVEAVVTGALPPEVQAFVPEWHKMMTVVPLHELWRDAAAGLAEHWRTDGRYDEHPDRG